MKHLIIITFLFLWRFDAVGQSMEDISLPNVVDNTTFTLSQNTNKKAVVIIFFSGKCAYSAYYIERILSLEKEFSSQGVEFVLVNSNNSDYVPEESPESMKEYATTYGIRFPYLADKEKKMKNILHATRTPEIFVLKSEQNSFSVVYKGAIDDSPQSASDIGHAYLQEALLNLLANKKIELNQTRPIGCLIK